MAKPTQTTDVDQNVTEVTDVARQTPFQQMLRAMAMEATADATDSSFAGDDLNAILTAETEEEVWEADERGPLNFQHLADCELEVIDLTVKYSRGTSSQIVTPFVIRDDQGRERKMYLLVTLVRVSDAGEKKTVRLPAIGEVFTANTSARFVVAKLWTFYVRGLINPDTGKTLECVVKEIDLGDEQSVLKLRPMPKRTIRTVTE